MKRREDIGCSILVTTHNCSSLTRFPNSVGREPFKLFELRDSDMRFLRFPSSFGTDPDNAFMPRLLVFARDKV